MTKQATSIDTQFMEQAIHLASDNVRNGGGPFGAVIVKDGVVIATGQNRVTRDMDPSAHAEVTAIRNACTILGDFSLAGAILYTSCEPCPMCLATSLWARLDRVVFAADRDAAAEGGFDDRKFYETFAKDRSEWDVPVDSLAIDGSFAPFRLWLDTLDRTHY